MKIIIKGWIEIDKWEGFAEINDLPIHRQLNREIELLGVNTKNSYSCNERNEWNQNVNSLVENVFIKLHVSDKEMTLEEANDKLILASIGELDIFETWYGYSEYTIEGYELESFKLKGNQGEHDLEKILLDYVGKYLIMEVEIRDFYNF